MAHADNADGFVAESSEHHENVANGTTTYRNEPAAFSRHDERILKKARIEIGEIQTVLGNIGEPLWLNYLRHHHFYSQTGYLSSILYIQFNVLS
jgi:hypothetical protein